MLLTLGYRDSEFEQLLLLYKYFLGIENSKMTTKEANNPIRRALADGNYPRFTKLLKKESEATRNLVRVFRDKLLLQ